MVTHGLRLQWSLEIDVLMRLFAQHGDRTQLRVLLQELFSENDGAKLLIVSHHAYVLARDDTGTLQLLIPLDGGDRDHDAHAPISLLYALSGQARDI